MSAVQRKQVKFQDQVQVLSFNKKQAVTQLLGCGKEEIPLYEGESEFTKKRRTMKQLGGKRRSREGVRMVLERQRDIEAQFWAAYCRQVWAKINRLCQEACYGCSHRKTDERHHNTCQLSDEESIRRFMEMAVGDVRCDDVIREWHDALSGFNPSLSENDMLLFDTQWVLTQMGRPDRTAILLELMVDMVQPSMSDEELLEAVEMIEKEQEMQPFISDEDLLEAIESIEKAQENTVEEYDASMFEFSDEFFDAMKRWQESEEEKEPGAIQPESSDDVVDTVNPELLQAIESITQEEEPFEHSYFPVNQWGSGAGQMHYSLTETSRRHIPKFGTVGVDYRLRVQHMDVRGLTHVLKALDNLFTSILSDMTRGMANHDQVRFVIHSPQLNSPISLPFMPLKELTPRRIMFEVERVLQSHEEFVLGDDLHLNLIHVNMPSGSGNLNRKRGGVNLQNQLQRKHFYDH